MATTLQKPPHPSQMDPRLRRAVYAKYREMLVSKNNQANEMIKQLPAYMVREDRGFNTNFIVNDVPLPPPIPGNNLPAQRLQTQISEAPACVQNAMMTKDKKPFTYTPGGIDLSQIKSPRMAKRISANANSPGITNTPKVSPLAQINNNGSNSPMINTPQTPQSAGVPPPPPPPPMGSLAMGMPFQVFPTGPPSSSKTQTLNKPQTNGPARKSPQSFEPPPMGCRPEIKIPENPMAILKKVPRPQTKDDFWIQEYCQDKSRNSAPNEDDIRQYITSPTIQQYQQPEYTPPKAESPKIQNVLPQKPASPVIQQKPSTPQSAVPQFMQKRSPTPPEQKEVNIPIRNIKLKQENRSSPTRVQINQSSPIIQQQQSQLSSASPVTVKNVVFEPIQQNNFNNQAQSYQSPMQNYQQPQQPQTGGKIILSTMPKRQQEQQATQHLGSLYIPPPNIDDKQFLLTQQSPPWMSSKQMTPLDTPEWVNRDEIDNFMQQNRNMNLPQSAGPKEHVVPISFEKSPATQNYGPFYGTPQHQINSVITPKVDPNVNKFVNQGYNNIEYPQTPQSVRPYAPNQRQQQPAGTRIIPIQVEGVRAPQNENTIVIQSDPRSPASPRMNAFGQPTQSRSFKLLQQVTGTLGDESDDNSNESKPKNKSDDDDDAPMKEQRAIFSRPLGPNDMNESQLKRLQLSESDRAFMDRVKNQVDEEVYLHTESDPRYRGSAIPSKAFKCLQKMTDSSNNCINNQNTHAASAGRQIQKNVQDDSAENQMREPGLYQGSAIPSRSFKILQSMTQPENAADNSNDNSDIEGNSYGNIGNNYYNNYHNCNPLNCQNCHNNLPNNQYHCTVPQTPQMYPPFMMPPQYAALYDWYDPQNNPWAAYYCQLPGYDSNYFGYLPPSTPQMPSHSRSQTPQPSQMSQSQTGPIPGPMPCFYPAYPPFFILPPPYMGFRPISASRETTPCFSEAERYQNMSTASDDRSRRAVSCTPTCCQHAKSFQVENLSNKFNTFEEPLTRSVSVQSENLLITLPPEPPENKSDTQNNQHVEYPLACDIQMRKSLKSIPSVGNVNLIDDCDLEELKAKPIVTTCDDDDNISEMSEDTTEVEDEISQDTETVEIHYPHQLSVIYEENESTAANERRSSICSRSSTLSDCSTTLMEEDNISIDQSGDELEDENSSSVTVRLPLKFSFTRSKDNIVNTTLTVGESESEVNEIQEKSPSPMPVVQSNSLSNNSSANDISVTFSLKSKSKSKTPERLVQPTLSAVKCDSIEEVDDNECSVNISLPRRKSKSIEIEESSTKRFRKDSEPSENSADNKNHIDNSLYTSLDALEEIKKGMAEITNSLFSKLCTVRKSAINIPEQERNRSGSFSYIDSIESDEENEDGSCELLSDHDDLEPEKESNLINTSKQFEVNENKADEDFIDEESPPEYHEFDNFSNKNSTSNNKSTDYQERQLYGDSISEYFEPETHSQPKKDDFSPDDQKLPIKPRDTQLNICDIPDILQKVSKNLQELLVHTQETPECSNDSLIDFEEDVMETVETVENKKQDFMDESCEAKIIQIPPIIEITKAESNDTSENSQNQEKEGDDDEEEEVDFWGQIVNKNQDNDYIVSKTSTHSSSRYWFEEETENDTEPPKNDGFEHYEINDVTTSVSFASINDAATIENEENENEALDFWKDYDSDCDYGTKARKFFDSDMREEDEEMSQTEEIDDAEVSIYDDPMQSEDFENENEQKLPVYKDNVMENCYDSKIQNMEQDSVENKQVSDEKIHSKYQNIQKSIEIPKLYGDCNENSQKYINFDEYSQERECFAEKAQETNGYAKYSPENVKNDFTIPEENENIEITDQNDENLKRPSTPYTKSWETKSEYDDDSDTESCKAFENEQQNEEIQQSVEKQSKEPEKISSKYYEEEIGSDEEWTEEEIEVTDDDNDDEIETNIPQAQKMEVTSDKNKIEKVEFEFAAKSNRIENLALEKTKMEVTLQNNEEESEKESEYEESEEEIEIEEKVADVNNKIENYQKSQQEKTPSCSESEEESDESEDDKAQAKVQNSNQIIRNSSSRIIKGKSLVNVNSFIQSESDKLSMKVLKEKIDNECNDESSSEEEEIDDPLPIKCSSSNIINSHSNDDCHDILTPQEISYIERNNNNSNNNMDNDNNNKVLLSHLKEIHSVDSKSNMTSESGISFEHNEDSDGYEEDSEDENIINNSNKRIDNLNDQNEKAKKEPKIPQLSKFDERSCDKSKEIKVNVKGRISMFERAMSEEKTIERKEIPKVSSKYSFRHREKSEPPSQFIQSNINNNNTINNNKNNSDRAASEVKELPKNQKLIELINQRKSLPPPPTTNEKYEVKSVKEKISSFETSTSDSDANEKRENYRRYGNSKAQLSPLVRSIEESGEEDSGVTSDFCKQLSENETDSENFPELRKLSRYERASTHSRLYKLLQGDDDIPEKDEPQDEAPKETTKIPYKSKKIIHNVSVTRRQNPQAVVQAETMEERRQRLCLPLTHQSSSGAESMSSSTTPSPTPGPVNEKLVNELVQSLLSQKRGKMFRNLPIEKLHAAAVKILQDDMESNATFSSADESTVPTVDSTPALTPQEFRNNSSYTEYYDSWQSKDINSSQSLDDFGDIPLMQSKAFRTLQDQQSSANKKLWSARCPRILSSKSINKDLARLSEVRESESPEPNHSRSPSIRSMSTEPMSGENRIKNNTHHNHQERHKAAANT